MDNKSLKRISAAIEKVKDLEAQLEEARGVLDAMASAADRPSSTGYEQRMRFEGSMNIPDQPPPESPKARATGIVDAVKALLTEQPLSVDYFTSNIKDAKPGSVRSALASLVKQDFAVKTGRGLFARACKE